MKTKRVLVTGGAGFIGSELVRQLAAQGHAVSVVDNLVNGKRENLEPILGDQVKLFVADVRDQKRMAELVSGMDVIFHLACLGVRHSVHSPKENHDVNADATLNLLLAARQAQVGRFVYVSTSEVYGTARTVPMTEDHTTFPHTVYGASKLAGECYTRAFWETYQFPTVVVRPFNAYGPRCHHEGDSGEVIPKFMLRSLANRPLVIFGDGSQTRDFTYVGDTARGILLAGMTDAALGQTINLGSGKEIRIDELAKRVTVVTGRPDAEVARDQPRPGDVLRLFADSSRAQKLLGFKPEVTLDEGLGHLMAWSAEQGIAPEVLLEKEVERNWVVQEDPAHV